MVNNIFREIAIELSKKQPKMVDQLLEEAPIFATIPMEGASHDLWNLYEEQDTVVGASLVDVDDELPEVYSESKLKQIDLSILGGKEYVGEDKALIFGGAAAYFAKQQASILKKTGQDAEAGIIYNNLRAYAEANHTAAIPKLIDVTGSANTNYTILCVNWAQGEITGLFREGGFGRGALMDITPLSGGNLFEKTISGKSILVYGARLKSYIGIQLANARYVSAIVNIDRVNSKTPTAAQIDSTISNARGTSARTVLYMHPDVLNMLYALKYADLQMRPQDTDLNSMVLTWNGIPIITSYNFLRGTENNVTVA